MTRQNSKQSKWTTDWGHVIGIVQRVRMSVLGRTTIQWNSP
ncbi:MAG: hypothetical protein R3A48_03940 [Polyangiales bacterium]